MLLAFCGFVCSVSRVSLPPEIVDRIMDEQAVGDFVSRQHLRIQDVPFQLTVFENDFSYAATVCH